MTSRNCMSFLKKYLFDIEILRLMALVVLVNPLFLVIQMLLAKYFGAGHEYDAYALAVFIIMYIGSVLGHVFTSVVVPFVIKLRSTLGARELLGFQNTISAMFAVPALVFALLLIFWPDEVVELIGSSLPMETKDYAARMLQILAVPGILVITVAMGKAILNLNGKYRLATSMPVANGVIMLATMIVLHERMGIWSVVLGFAISQAAQTAMLWGRVVAGGFVTFTRPSLPEGTLRKLWSLSWALLLAQAILLLYQFIDKIFAATLEPGSISSLAYAFTIKNFGVQLFSLTLVTVMFTKLSEQIAAGDLPGCGGYIRDNIDRVTRLVLPATLILALSSGEIVRVLFMRGAFTPEAAERTTSVMAMYSLGIPALILNLIVGRVFHSLQRMKEKIWLGVQFLVTNVIGNLLLIGPLKVTGLALASTITIYIHLLLSMWVLHRYRLGLGVSAWFRVFLRYHVIAVVTYLVYAAVGFERLMENWSLHGTTSGDLVICCCKAAFVCIVFGGLFFLWGLASRRSTVK